MTSARIDRRKFASLALSPALLAWSASRGQPKVEKTRITLALGARASFQQLPLIIAQQLGYFKAEGLDVELAEQVSDAAVAQAIAGGAADVASGDFHQVLMLQASGQPAQCFALHGRAPMVVAGLSSRQFGKTAGLADLRGRRIGVPALGSTAHLVSDMLLRRVGLAAGEVTHVPLGTAAAAMTALRAGQVDMLCAGDPLMTQLEQKGDIRVLADTRNLKGTGEVFGGPMLSGCLFAATGFVRRNPGSAQALANAMIHALKWLQTAGPSDLIRTVPDAYLLGDRALYLACFEKMREGIATDGLASIEGARLALRVLAEFDPAMKRAQLNPADCVNNEFARRAKDRYKL